MTTGAITSGGRSVADGCADESAVVAEGSALSDSEDGREDEAVRDEHRRLVEIIYGDVAEMPKNWNAMTVRERRDWMYRAIDRQLTNLPKSLGSMVVGATIRGDCGRPVTAPVPDWLDREKFARGQRFATNNLASVFLAELLSLIGLFSFEDGLKPLIMTGKSSEPFTAFKRYLSTARRVKSWYSSDPWTEGTAAYRDVQAVRRMHAVVRKRLIDSSLEDIDEASRIGKPWSTARPSLLEDFRGSCPAAAPGQCPYMFGEKELHKRPKGMNQGEMAATQSGFVCLVILHPEAFGIHGASEEDLEAFCHVWRSLGYLLGMEDEFNFCNGTLEEVRQRSRDFLEYWVKPNLRDVTPEWEHMLRCVLTGIRYYFPGMSYEHAVMYFAELLDIRLPLLEASLSYRSWFRYKMMKITLRWTARLRGTSAAMNRGLVLCMERALRYTDEELAELEKQSTIAMSKGVEVVAAAPSDLVTATHWHRNSIFVLLSTCVLLSLPIVAKKFVRMFLLIEAGSALSS